MKKIFAFLLIAIGAPLEGYFYWYSFTREGMADLAALASGFGMILLLAVFVYMAREKRAFILPVLLLSLFAVLSTSAGQSFATLNLYMESSGTEADASLAQWEIDDGRRQIIRLDAEYDKLDKEEDASITSTEDRAKWRTALAAADGLRKANRAARDKELARISAATNRLGLLSGTRQADIYSYYSALFGISPRWLQFIRHSLLSAFLVTMTPCGVALWLQGKGEGNVLHRAKTFFGQKKADGGSAETGSAPSRRARKKAETPATVALDLERALRVAEKLARLPEVVSPREAGRALETSHTPIYRAVMKGDIPWDGKSPLRVKRADVQEWWDKKYA